MSDSSSPTSHPTAYPTSFPTSIPTAAPSYDPSSTYIVTIIFVSNLLAVYLILYIYFIIGNFTYIDELKYKILRALSKDLGAEIEVVVPSDSITPRSSSEREIQDPSTDLELDDPISDNKNDGRYNTFA
jgi:hypothetical protein